MRATPAGSVTVFISSQQFFRAALIGLCVTLSGTGYAQSGDTAEPQQGADPETAPSWLDTRYDQVSDRADKLAIWLDGFFSQSRSVEDTASTLIRFRPQYEWDEDNGSEWKMRANGRLRLPSISDRLSLVFVGEDGDFEREFYEPGLASDGSSTVGVEYRVSEVEHHRIDLIAGLKAGPKGKLGTRYRYQLPFLKRNRFRFSEELYWIGGDGFGTLTRVDLDRSYGKDILVRWANKARYSEESNGVEWNSQLIWAKRLSEKSAINFAAFIRGETDPRYLKSRGFSSSFRRQFLKSWLFWEVQPRYEWRKDNPGENRNGVFSVDFRLEVVIGERELAPSGIPDDPADPSAAAD